MKLHIFSSENDFHATVILEIVPRIRTRQSKGEVFRLGLSGGSTPRSVYQKLAEEKSLDWSLIELYLVDERYVPLDHQHSNFRMIKETLLNQLPMPVKRIVFFDTTLPIEKCLEQYESQLDPTQKEFFDLVLLGIGPDGHTASLFPDSPALEIRDRWVAHTTTEHFDVRDRLTLTYPALESSKELFFLLSGEGKKDVLKRLQDPNADEKEFPALKFIGEPKTQIFFWS